ncbi:MAG: alpha/beta hydrolase [Alphaproteobacteria bacterium]|nr:alpha/beta hydrolase [Alphaproteobacteria bacterium]MBU1517173.1 alpha/beta hydrolase [Alphaproteobacteria bacterium]MBU2093291.1 alpha/beta hydrolase [Alphaproteobacteria bacterium]MBU2150032.1 alpha/beta hydrolase [Alphaproteobacteria bacterium]MBU2307789.1 alpha/beta hydrolase [Alphaproteobacteria bacterium]
MPTVVMTHGAFCGGWAFEVFRAPFEARGWTVLTPDLPGHGEAGSVAGVSMTDYAKSLVTFCAELPEPPVLLGHSMGGLVCQMAARRVNPRALVLLAPSPPWGITGSSIEEAVTAFGVQMVDPFWGGAVSPDRHIMRQHSLDRTPKPLRDSILDRLRPESGRAVREVLNWWMDPFMTTSVGVGALPMPSLAIVGDRDVVHPVATVRQTAERIGAQLRVMPGMSHWLIGEEGWEGVAEIALTWLESDAQVAAA